MNWREVNEQNEVARERIEKHAQCHIEYLLFLETFSSKELSPCFPGGRIYIGLFFACRRGMCDCQSGVVAPHPKHLREPRTLRIKNCLSCSRNGLPSPLHSIA